MKPFHGMTTRWNQLLFYFSQGRAAGRRAWDYIPFTAIAPSYFPFGVRTPACILEQVRGDISSELIKLRLGSAICIQDISHQNTFYNPAAPTMLGTIDWMLWREDGYQVTSVCMHVHSPRGYVWLWRWIHILHCNPHLFYWDHSITCSESIQLPWTDYPWWYGSPTI